MPIIVDSNIIIAALIRDSTARWLILDLYPDIYYPEAMAGEITKYRDVIQKKAKLNAEEFARLFQKLFKYIKIIPDEDLLEHKKEAQQIMADIDPSDHLLLAAAFSLSDAVIWSDDPHLKRQTRIKAYTTAEILENIRQFLQQ